MPLRLTSPMDQASKPLTPQNALGVRMDPPVSLPVATRHMPVATAMADPPLEPPGTCAKFHGLREGPAYSLAVVGP